MKTMGWIMRLFARADRHEAPEPAPDHERQLAEVRSMTAASVECVRKLKGAVSDLEHALGNLDGMMRGMVPARSAEPCPTLSETLEDLASFFPLVVFDEMPAGDVGAFGAALDQLYGRSVDGVRLMVGREAGVPAAIVLEVGADGRVCTRHLFTGTSFDKVRAAMERGGT